METAFLIIGLLSALQQPLFGILHQTATAIPSRHRILDPLLKHPNGHQSPTTHSPTAIPNIGIWRPVISTPLPQKPVRKGFRFPEESSKKSHIAKKPNNHSDIKKRLGLTEDLEEKNESAFSTQTAKTTRPVSSTHFSQRSFIYPDTLFPSFYSLPAGSPTYSNHAVKDKTFFLERSSFSDIQAISIPKKLLDLFSKHESSEQISNFTSNIGKATLLSGEEILSESQNSFKDEANLSINKHDDKTDNVPIKRSKITTNTNSKHIHNPFEIQDVSASTYFPPQITHPKQTEKYATISGVPAVFFNSRGVIGQNGHVQNVDHFPDPRSRIDPAKSIFDVPRRTNQQNSYNIFIPGITPLRSLFANQRRGRNYFTKEELSRIPGYVPPKIKNPISKEKSRSNFNRPTQPEGLYRFPEGNYEVPVHNSNLGTSTQLNHNTSPNHFPRIPGYVKPTYTKNQGGTIPIYKSHDIDNHYSSPHVSPSSAFAPRDENYSYNLNEPQTYGPLSDDYALKHENSHPNNHGTSRYQNNNAYQIPTQDYGVPQTLLARPSEEYSNPRNLPITPSQNYDNPPISFQAPSTEYTIPHNFDVSSFEYDNPQSSLGSPSQDYIPPNTFEKPTQEYAIPQNLPTTPSQNPGNPTNSFELPSTEYSIPHNFEESSFEYDNSQGSLGSPSQEYIPPNTFEKPTQEHAIPQNSFARTEYNLPRKYEPPTKEYGIPEKVLYPPNSIKHQANRYDGTQKAYTTPATQRYFSPSSNNYHNSEILSKPPSKDYGSFDRSKESYSSQVINREITQTESDITGHFSNGHTQNFEDHNVRSKQSHDLKNHNSDDFLKPHNSFNQVYETPRKEIGTKDRESGNSNERYGQTLSSSSNSNNGRSNSRGYIPTTIATKTKVLGPTHSPRKNSISKADSVSTSPCSKTKYDPDGDCIRGESIKDYPVLDRVQETDFVCSDKVPGIYADEEARCQVWHYCLLDGRKESFICPIGTVFNQRLFTCDWWHHVDCSKTQSYFHLNERLYQRGPEPNKPSDLYKIPRKSG